MTRPRLTEGRAGWTVPGSDDVSPAGTPSPARPRFGHRAADRLASSAVVGGLLVLGGCTSKPASDVHAASASPSATSVVNAGQPQAGPSGNTYREKSLRFLMQCMSEKGWKPVYNPQSGGVTYDIPKTQTDAWTKENLACGAEFERLNPRPAYSATDFRRVYQKEIATMECLERLGYPQRSHIPSEQQFVDALVHGKPPTWTAYDAVGSINTDLFDEINRKCPQAGDTE